MKLEKQKEARELRSQGMSVNNIANKLEVSKSTVSVWVRGVVLTKEQMETLRQSNPAINNQHKGGQVRKENAERTRLQYQQEGFQKAKEGNLLHQAACMLYWAEGAKSINSFDFCNSDPYMIKLMMDFLTNTLMVDKEKITFKIQCYTNNNISIDDIENYWTSLTGLKTSQARKHIINFVPTSSKQLKKNKLVYGCCHLRIGSTELVQHIFGAIKYYANIDEEFYLNNKCQAQIEQDNTVISGRVELAI